MAISFEDVTKLQKDLEIEYAARHRDHKRLRDYWHGRYWETLGAERSGLSSLFADIARQSDTGAPDFKIIHNILHEVCRKYQSFLSPLPMIRVYVDPPESQNRRNQATKKERYLYGLWGQRPLGMKDIVNRIAWYLPLMGDCFLGAFPDVKNKTIRPILRSPENAFPVPSYDGSTLDSVIFKWETTKQQAAKQFPNYNVDKPAKPWIKRKMAGKTNKVEVMEYSDGNEFARWVGTQKVNGVVHNYGFNLFDQLNFVYVPDEPWNMGAVQQIVSMNQAENMLRSLLLQAVLENVFPKYVLIDPSKSPEELDMGPGAVWGVNQGGDVKTLSPPLQALPVQQGFLAENERAIKQGSGVNEANFGQPKGSIVTGKAINEMESSGAGDLVEMVQGIGLGSGLVSWNEKALCMGNKMFKDDTLNVFGYETASTMEIVPKRFSINIKGSELVGSYRNEVVFGPLLGLHEKLVMNLQAMGAGLVSKEHSRNQLGIPDSQAMDEEILGERIQDIVVGAIEQELMAAATPEGAASAEDKALAFLAGATPVSNQSAAPSLPPPGMPPGAPPGAPPGGGGGGMPIANMPGGGQLAAPALRMPGGASFGLPTGGPQGAAPTGQGPGGAPPEPPNPDRITIDEAVQAFQNLQPSGRVFLVGEIVQSHETDDNIEVALTDGSDRQVIADGLPQWSDRLTFHTVSKEPVEPHVEVTPGAVPEAAGEEPDLAALMGQA
jgi:hypothetical protein